ncbi:MAG: TIGR03751 family conjugal transfer lipoprotein [Gammaproteobacteria bacterium]
MPMRLIRIAAPVSISVMLLLGGCASTKEDVFPKNMKPMSEVYDQHFAKLRTRGIAGARVRLQGERTQGAEPELVGYTREAHTEIEVLFPVLPNPELLLYVYPHLGEDGAPVPGYATAFPLYERVEYALPGEVP